VSEKTYYTGTLVHERCISCGVSYGLDSAHQSELKASKKFFYCPNGHGQQYAETTEVRLRRELEEKNRRITELACEVTGERNKRYEQQKQRKRAFTLLRNERARAVKGQCPCCNEVFPKLREHMETAHPEHLKTVEEES
jgi:hypothetical protein